MTIFTGLSVRILLPICLTILYSHSGVGDESGISIIPRPAQVERREGFFRLDVTTSIIIGNGREELLTLAAELASVLGGDQKLPIILGDSAPVSGNIIRLSISDTASRIGSEEYHLTVGSKAISLTAASPAGIFYGMQTLLQLLSPEILTIPRSGVALWDIPAVEIADAPRFPWRGIHLDVARHFFKKEFIKKYLDLMATYKFNVFHWHLTDDQGWRVEIRKYPLLTKVGAWRNETMGDSMPHGGFYTQEDIREIVDYARQRHITIVPEIEMPGHSLAALAAYPELSCAGGPFSVATEWGVVDDAYCAGEEQTFTFLEDVLREVMDLFPGRYIHCGGDECPKVRWKHCPKCQRRIRNEGLKSESELQSYFIRRIEKFLGAGGRQLVGWDEILEGGLAPGATVMSWRGIDGGIEAARAGHDVVMTPSSYCYFDHYQAAAGEPKAIGGFLPIDSVYAYEPVPSMLAEDTRKHIIGAQANMWTEYISDSRHVEYMLMPRMLAMSEVLWTPKDRREYGDFKRRAEVHFDRLKALDVHFRVPTPVGLLPRSAIFGDTVLTLSPGVTHGEIRYTLDGSEPSSTSPLYTSPIPITGTITVKACTILKNGLAGNTVTGTLSRVNRRRNGLAFRYYEGRWRKIPRFNRLKPALRGRAYDLELNGIPHRSDYFGIQFSGHLRIERSGRYRFTLRSDDGSKLYLDNKRIINNDGLHGMDEASGSMMLKAGLHPMRVEYFDHSGREYLELLFEGEGMPLQPIPPRLFFP